jgi:hypothetical protein
VSQRLDPCPPGKELGVLRARTWPKWGCDPMAEQPHADDAPDEHATSISPGAEELR